MSTVGRMTAICLILVAGLTPAIHAEVDATAAWLIVPGRSVGPIHIGMSLMELESQVGPAEETGMGAAWEYLSSGYAVLIDTETHVVTAILAGGGNEEVRLDKRFHARTAEGIGMGSTRPQLLEAFGEPSRERLQDESLSLEYHHLGIWLTLNHGEVTWLAVRPAR